jgi:integral membrane protein
VERTAGSTERSVGGERRTSGALTRYQAIAWIVSILLIVLVVIGVPLKYAGHHPGVAKWVGIAHGMFFYPLYLILTFDLGRRVKMPMLRLILTMVAGTVPFLSFYAEHETTKWVQDRPDAPVPADQGAI